MLWFLSLASMPGLIITVEPITIILGCERGHCHDDIKYDCHIYDVQFNSLKVMPTNNMNAVWGSRETCHNDGDISLPRSASASAST